MSKAKAKVYVAVRRLVRAGKVIAPGERVIRPARWLIDQGHVEEQPK